MRTCIRQTEGDVNLLQGSAQPRSFQNCLTCSKWKLLPLSYRDLPDFENLAGLAYTSPNPSASMFYVYHS
jgi:hypothetical protein